MNNRRVVVTGFYMFTPIGNGWEEFKTGLKAKQNAVQYMQDWEKYKGMNTKLAAPMKSFEIPEHYTRKKIRSMGKVAIQAVRASELALKSAGLLENEEIKQGGMGVACGSSSGSVDAVYEFYSMKANNDLKDINATTYLRLMDHTTSVNIGVFFGLTGRLITTSTACTSGSLSIGYSYEAIKSGKQDMMLAGGAEALDPTHAAIFDVLFATSVKNDTPKLTPRPFDKDRDGLVIGEGAAMLVLEELEHAKKRGAKIYAEIVGFGTNTDGAHVTQPNQVTVEKVMRLSLEDAGLQSSDIGYINAHGTSTFFGDITESHAVNGVFGKNTPISTQKGYIGHTLGACGAIEAISSINMMNENWFAPNLNLENIDDKCADINYIKGDGLEKECEYVMSNNFAFGGINTSLIFKKLND